MGVKVSAAIIHRDDPHLPKTVASIRPFVDEIVIVDTGSADGGELARSLADVYDRMTSCNFEDLPGTPMREFNLARQRSFELCTGDWIVWIDSDDTIRDGEKIREAIEKAHNEERPRIVCKYEYSYTAEGRCDTVQWRERIVRNDGHFHWIQPVHENLVARDGQQKDVFDHGPIWEHRRSGPPADRERNLRILRWYAETHPGENEAWLAFNLGGACMRSALFAEAKQHFEDYVKISGWDDQKVVAYLHLVDCCIALDPFGQQAEADGREKHGEAEAWAIKAHELRPTWAEPNVALAKIAMLRGGSRADGHDAMPEVIAHCKAALAGKTESPVVVNVNEQEVRTYELMQAAHETLGEWADAYSCVRYLLGIRLNDSSLRLDEVGYEYELGLRKCQGLDIVIPCPSFTTDPWDPVVFAEKGCGGSETAVIEMAKRLAAKGHRVRVYGNPKKPGLYDGVEYRAFTLATGPKCDVVIAWRSSPLLETWRGKANVVWVHDVAVHGGHHETLSLKADKVLALSEWHKDALVAQYKLHRDHVEVTRNGIDVSRFDDASTSDWPRDPHRAIYSSSPDRGLAVLLDVWPEIRKRVPDAKLDVFYGFELWKVVAPDEQHRYLIDLLERRMKTLPGVTFHGKVDQKTLADAMQSSGVWAYPTWWTETSCITAMEAQAAGLRIVTTSRAALKETVADRGVLLDGDWLTDEYRNDFVNAVVDAMRVPDGVGWPSRRNLHRYAREHFSWDGVADEWDRALRQLVEDAEFGVMPPYQEFRP